MRLCSPHRFCANGGIWFSRGDAQGLQLTHKCTPKDIALPVALKPERHLKLGDRGELTGSGQGEGALENGWL